MGRGGSDDVLRIKMLRLREAVAEVVPSGGGEVGGRQHFVHEPGHHDAVSLDTHAAGSHVGAQQPGAVGGCLLAFLNHAVGAVFEHQGMRVAQEAGVGGIAGNLIVEEQAPVVAVGHGQFTVG